MVSALRRSRSRYFRQIFFRNAVKEIGGVAYAVFPVLRLTVVFIVGLLLQSFIVDLERRRTLGCFCQAGLLNGATLRSSREVLEIVESSTNTNMKSIGKIYVRSETRFLSFVTPVFRVDGIKSNTSFRICGI